MFSITAVSITSSAGSVFWNTSLTEAVYITHYQKPDPSKDLYSIKVLFKNVDGMIIINPLETVQSRDPVAVSGFNEQLPAQLIITTEWVNADPMRFAYGNQSWNSDSSQCSMKAYNSKKK